MVSIKETSMPSALIFLFIYIDIILNLQITLAIKQKNLQVYHHFSPFTQASTY